MFVIDALTQLVYINWADTPVEVGRNPYEVVSLSTGCPQIHLSPFVLNWHDKMFPSLIAAEALK